MNTIPVYKNSVGKPRKVKDGDELWTRAVEYFEWNHENPLISYKPFSFQGETKLEPVPVMRAMSIRGLCTHMNIGKTTWYEMTKKPEYADIVEKIENIIFNQQYEGAAGGLLKENIIARSLGLKDQSEVTEIKSEVTASQIALTNGFSYEEVDQALRYRLDGNMSDVDAVNKVLSEREQKKEDAIEGEIIDDPWGNDA